MGRNAASANYFWYLRDPAGPFAEHYYSEMDERAPDEYFWDRPPDAPNLPPPRAGCPAPPQLGPSGSAHSNAPYVSV
jgi:hypothetical protein